METEAAPSLDRGKYGTKRPPDKPHGQRVTLAETVELLALHAKGISQSEIARALRLSVQQVNTQIQRHRSTTSSALGVLQANAHKAAQAWVGAFEPARKRGEHRPMRDALIAVGVVAPDPQNAGITVIVGSGDVAIHQLSHTLEPLQYKGNLSVGNSDNETSERTFAPKRLIP